MKNRLSILFILLLSCSVALLAQTGKAKSKLRYKAKSYGVPAWPYQIEELQPDGTKFTYYLKGDGAVHWRETVDGYPIIRNAKGFFEYVKLGPDNKIIPSGVRSSANLNLRNSNERSYLKGLKRGIPYSAAMIEEMKDSYAPASAESEQSKAFGSEDTMHLLLLLVEFPDAAHSHDTLEFDSLMNHDNYHGTGSFRDYYYENSYGQLTVVTTVSSWYEAPHNHNWYGDDSDPNGLRARGLVRDLVEMADPFVDYSQFDNDGDGEVEGIMVIHQGIGAEHGDGTCIWSHSWALGNPPIVNDGVLINAYTINPEERPAGGGGTVMNGIGTACHEFGHNLGLPDYYDTDYSSSGGESEHLGYWDCMASGSYNNSSNSPAHHNAYSKELLGWLTISELNATAPVTMTNVENNQLAYKFYTTTANEYFVLENRQNIGFDTYIPGHGLLIYHVDSSYIASAGNCINCDPSHQGFDMEEADGRPGHGSFDAFPAGRIDFTDAGVPNSVSWAGNPTNKPIADIEEIDSVISFNFTVSTAPCIFNVVQTPSKVTDTDNVQIQADITDEGTVTSALLEWCIDGTSFNDSIMMSVVSGNTYQTDTGIPTHSYGTVVSYRIVATDNDAQTAISTILSYKVAFPYCDAGADNDYEDLNIRRVVVGDIDNSSGNASAAENNYEDFTDVSTDMVVDSSYVFTVYTPPVAYTYYQLFIWVDWNGDYDFFDAGENVYTSAIGPVTSFTDTITPPPDTVPVSTRMRIRLLYNDSTLNPNETPCGNSGYGEVEDYTINVIPSGPRYTLTVSATNGTVTKIPDQATYAESTVVTLEAIPDAGYHFNNWSDSLSGSDNPTTITMDSDKFVTANFIQSGTITISGINMGADVYIHSANGWQGTKARDGSGIITDLKPGTHILIIKETGNRTEMDTVTVSAGANTDVSVTLRNAIPLIFAAKDTVKNKVGGPINHGVTNSTVIDDIDRDGDVDLVVAEVYGDINYYLNNSGYELDRTVPLSLGVGERVRCIRCADIGADGERELIVALNTGEMFSLDITDDSETPFYTAGNELTGFDLFEGNDDGYPDLILGYANGTLKMAMSTGSGSWDTRQDVTLPGGSPLDVGDTATPLLMDLDGDGIRDLVTGNTFGDVRWYKGNGTAEFTARDSVNSGGMPLMTNGNTGISMTFNTTMGELPFTIVTDEDGYIYQLPAILLGDVNGDGKVFINDYSIFVESWQAVDGGAGWNANVNFDVTPNGSSDQEINISDQSLFIDSWRKEK
jgi:M6 family metalloprotease-like protein